LQFCMSPDGVIRLSVQPYPEVPPLNSDTARGLKSAKTAVLKGSFRLGQPLLNEIFSDS
jgi:hypothetical protein